MAETTTAQFTGPNRRTITASQTATAAGSVGLAAALGDYIGQCLAIHHYIPPERALVIMVLAAIMPIVHLSYKIVINRLKKAAGEDNE